MPEYPIPLPTASPFEDWQQYIPLLITAVDEFLISPSLWAEADYPSAYGYMNDLMAWLQELIVEDVKAGVTPNDTTPGRLLEKLLAGAGVQFRVLNAGGNEQLQVTADSQAADIAVDVNLTIPTIIGTVPAGGTVIEVRFSVDTPFDAGYTLQVGVPGQTGLLMSDTQNAPQVENVYVTEPTETFVSEQAVWVYPSGAPGAGAGRVFLTIQE